MVNSKKINLSQDELTTKTIRRIFNRGKRKGYVSPAYIEKTVKGKDIPSEAVEELLETFKAEGIKLMDDEQAALVIMTGYRLDYKFCLCYIISLIKESE